MLSMIVATAKNGVIGNAGGIPWKLPPDMKRFKLLTMGGTLIMGRKTYESIGRPLPGRKTLIVSANGYVVPALPDGVVAPQVFASLEEAIRDVSGEPNVFIAGGAAIYAKAYQYTHRIYLTRVDLEPEGDVFYDPEKEEGFERRFATTDYTSFGPTTEIKFGYAFYQYDLRS